MARAPSVLPSAEKIAEAIMWLENGGTKKGACDILGVSSNPRMEKIIEEFLHKAEVAKVQKAKKRKEAVLPAEAASIITDYLNGRSFNDISESCFRSVGMVKHVIHKYGAEFRITGSIDPFNPPALPDEAVTDFVEMDEYVWVAKYGCIGQVCGFHGDAVKVYVLGNGIQQKSYQPVYELGSLRHLTAIGVDISRFVEYTKGDEVKVLIYEAFKAASKREAADKRKA